MTEIGRTPSITLTIDTPDGPMRTQAIGDERAPAVIVLMAALGVDDGLLDIAHRVADNGYLALVPDLYHRFGQGLSFDPATQMEEMVTTLRRLTDPMIVADVGALLATREDRPVGVIGFCMGGRGVIRVMATFPDLITVGSALHPSFLLQDSETSPHLDIARIQGELYIGFGGIDEIVPPAHWDAVREQIALHGTYARVDIHEGADHGFMLAGPRYHGAAAEASWEATLELLRGLREPRISPD